MVFVPMTDAICSCVYISLGRYNRFLRVTDGVLLWSFLWLNIVTSIVKYLKEYHMLPSILQIIRRHSALSSFWFHSQRSLNWWFGKKFGFNGDCRMEMALGMWNNFGKNCPDNLILATLENIWPRDIILEELFLE